jgi:hypothetical protein
LRWRKLFALGRFSASAAELQQNDRMIELRLYPEK